MARTKYLSTDYHNLLKDLPNFSASGSIKGMKDKFYGKDALLVKSGSYIYNCTSKPELYHLAK